MDHYRTDRAGASHEAMCVCARVSKQARGLSATDTVVLHSRVIRDTIHSLVIEKKYTRRIFRYGFGSSHVRLACRLLPCPMPCSTTNTRRRCNCYEENAPGEVKRAAGMAIAVMVFSCLACLGAGHA